MSKKLIDLKKYFFDCHLHLFNLSHPGFVMVINRFLLNNKLKIDSIAKIKIFKIFINLFFALALFILIFSLTALVSIKLIFKTVEISFYPIPALIILIIVCLFIIKYLYKLKKSLKYLTNVFYFMENDLASQLLLLERDFVSLDKKFVNNNYTGKNFNKYISENNHVEIKKMIEEAKNIFKKNNNKIKINAEEIEKVIITPLIMDFGYKKTTAKNIYYKVSPAKPMSEQIIDLYFGIRRYLDKSPYRIFEVYPFMGITPANYIFDDIKSMIDYYFRLYERDMEKFQNKFKERFIDGDFSIVMDKDRHFASLKDFFFAGIKLYPPLGCDLFPADKEEKKKIDYIYKYCADKGVPITVHYGKGGFDAAYNINDLTNPCKVDSIKNNYKNLRINLAHFGISEQKGKFVTNKWHDKIKEVISDTNNYFYTDVACKPYNVENTGLDEILDAAVSENKLFYERILFGSDIPVVLFCVGSYKTYLKKFLELCNSNKEFKKFYRENAYNFLFKR